MSKTTAVIIFILFLVCIVYQIAKSFVVRNIMKAISNQDYELVESITNMPLSQKLLGEHNTNLYKLKAFYHLGKVSEFDQLLTEMIEKDYKDKEVKKDFLELYYHTFLIKKNEKYATQLLKGIEQLEDDDCLLYNKQAFEVMMNGKTDLIDTMDKQIDSKKYYGFSLGVILFMIAKQYELLHNEEKALLFYQNALICFHPQAVYCPLVKERIKELDKGVNKE